jgi:predicted AlkP superfamily phosphohydrolase/phosphomutase
MDRINATFLAREGIAPIRGAAPAPNLMRRLRARVSDRVQQTVGQLAPVWVRDQVVNRTFTGRSDWSRTPALAVRGDVHTYVRYNLRGRESAGMLAPDGALLGRYEAWLTQCFHSLRDADSGEPVVRDVRFARDVFPGPRSHMLPDAIAAYRHTTPARRLRSELLGDLHTPIRTGRSGNHSPEGFCLVLEPTGECASTGALSHIRDLAPMLLRHYGFEETPQRSGGE